MALSVLNSCAFYGPGNPRASPMPGTQEALRTLEGVRVTENSSLLQNLLFFLSMDRAWPILC